MEVSSVSLQWMHLCVCGYASQVLIYKFKSLEQLEQPHSIVGTTRHVYADIRQSSLLVHTHYMHECLTSALTQVLSTRAYLYCALIHTCAHATDLRTHICAACGTPFHNVGSQECFVYLQMYMPAVAVNAVP